MDKAWWPGFQMTCSQLPLVVMSWPSSSSPAGLGVGAGRAQSQELSPGEQSGLSPAQQREPANSPRS